MGRPALHDRNYWAVHIAKQKSSGLTVAEYCHQHGFAVHQFYYGRRRALQDQLATAQREEPKGERKSLIELVLRRLYRGLAMTKRLIRSPNRGPSLTVRMGAERQFSVEKASEKSHQKAFPMALA